MALHTQVISTGMPNGFAGNYARQPDAIIVTRPAGGEDPIPFGAPLVYDSDNQSVVQAGATATAALFAGVAAAEVKPALTYADQEGGAYAPGDAVGVFQRGSINVLCAGGTPARGGAVYLRTGTSETYTGETVGSFTATNEASKTVQLTNCQWGGPADANGVAELVILTRNMA